MSTEEEKEKELGHRLREVRQHLNYSQEFVAQKLDMARTTISAIESGGRKVSSLELNQLAALYRYPVEYFLGEEPQHEDETTRAILRTAKDLTETDREKLLSFAQFLSQQRSSAEQGS